MKKIFIINIFCAALSLCIAQRVAPGVPPQHYQPPPSPQYQQQNNFQQQQQHHVPPNNVNSGQFQPNVNTGHYQNNQQVPVQHVDQYGNVINQPSPQVPVQQQHQQQHQQQQAPQDHHGGHHAHHGAPQQVLHTGNLQMEKDHIAEHMEVPIDTSKMTDQELQFHYFKMHDADNNNKLDGCELIKSLIHWHEKDGKKELHETYSDQQIEETIDAVLHMMDADKDGYISFSEYVTSGVKVER